MTARIAVLMTCHNRRVLTLASIGAVLRAGARADVEVRVVLTDDGSTDGTADAVRDLFPSVRIVAGDGTLFWNRGMLRAWETARETPADFYLWLNDDLAVSDDALVDMLRAWHAEREPRTIMVGKTLDPRSGAVTYGAYVRAAGMSRLRLRRMAAGETRAVTMNGNFVLIPARAADELGMLDPRYRHASGDVDYGLRASAAGYRIVECPRAVGEQTRNEAYGRNTTRMTLTTMRRAMTDPKRVPIGEWLHFTRRHGGPLWPVNFVARYAKMLATGAREGGERGHAS